MNTIIDSKKLEQLLKKARQTVKILFYIRKGLPVRDIAIKVKTERQVVDYYIKAVAKK